MSQVLARLEALREADSELTLDALGGMEAIQADREVLLASPEMPLLVSVLLQEWPQLPTLDQAAALIVESIPVQDAFALEDILDDTLSCPEALPLLALPLSRALRRRADGENAEAGIALEALTRLALGGWIRSLQVRSRLVEQAADLVDGAGGPDPDPVLIQRVVRALGAVAEVWDDAEVPSVLESLLVLEGFEDDIAFELAMLHMRTGLAEDTMDSALPPLRRAREWLSRCGIYEDRLDARIFHAALDALLSFTAGNTIAGPALEELHSMVVEYRLAGLHERPTWRQPRADATAAWVQLTDRLYALHVLHEPWWDPSALISAIARAYSAHRTIHLLVPPDVPYADELPEPGGATALPHLLQPRLVTALTAKGDSSAFLDRWLSLHSEDANTSEDARTAVRELQELLHAGGGSEAPKGIEIELGAVTSALALSAPVRDRLTVLLRNEPGLADELNKSSRAVLAGRESEVSEYANSTLRKLREDIDRITSLSGEAALRVDELLLFLVRYTRWSIEAETGGALGEPFLRPFTKDEEAPEEVDMAKHLAGRLYTSLSTSPRWEVKNLGAGRTDIVLFYGAFHLVIECKRELKNASMDYLSARYSVQAAAYGATDLPVGFLVVLDLTPKPRKVQLDQCLSVHEVPAAEPGGRPHAVLTVRIQGNTRSPSYSSTPAAYRRRTRAAQA
ncbi:hypothetical protein ABZT51_26715 [Streptomyces sp. NPDC005373]|uniref:hypothetical protein n=1 Tax=Streptomyces sp. NPDC005373 TaxID=3156879 RepID=UPI00339F6FB5